MAANPERVLTEEEKASIHKISRLIGDLFSCCERFKTNQNTRNRVVELLAQYYAALQENSNFERMMLQALKAQSKYSQFDTLCAMILYADKQLSTPNPQSLSEKLVKNNIIEKSAMEKVLNTIQSDSNASSEPHSINTQPNVMEMELASETPAAPPPETTNSNSCTADNANFNLTMFGGLCKIGLGATLIVAGVVLGIGLMALGAPSLGMGFVAGASVMWALVSVGALGVVSGLEDYGFFGRSDDPAAGNENPHRKSNTLKMT